MEKYAVWATRSGRLSFLRIYTDYGKGQASVAALLAAGVEEAGITGSQQEISGLCRRKFRGCERLFCKSGKKSVFSFGNKQNMKLSSIRPNPANPRIIKDYNFSKLKASLEQFPKMMALRPIVVDDAGMVLGGNMRLRALHELGYNEVPDSWVKQADELTEDEKRRFVITDNAGFGEWDWDVLANEWDAGELAEWGLDVPEWGNQDFSERNQEIDVDGLSEKMVIKLEYVFEEYNKVKEKLHEIADTPEQAVWNLLGLK